MSEATRRLMDKLAGPDGIIRFEHAGSHVVRWLSSGAPPDVRARFEDAGSETIAVCPECGVEFGRFDASYGTGTARQLAEIRHNGHKHNLENHQ